MSVLEGEPFHPNLHQLHGVPRHHIGVLSRPRGYGHCLKRDIVSSGDTGASTSLTRLRRRDDLWSNSWSLRIGFLLLDNLTRGFGRSVGFFSLGGFCSLDNLLGRAFGFLRLLRCSVGVGEEIRLWALASSSEQTVLKPVEGDDLDLLQLLSLFD